MSTLKSYFEQVATAFQNQPALWTPGWWYLSINNAVAMAKEESSAMDMFHYENLKILIHKISRAWSNCSSRLEITSLESLMQKIGHLLVLTFQTSLSSQIIENVMCYINISLNKENYSVEICSDSALITIMSTLSIPAPLVAPNVSVVGEKKSRAVASDQDTNTEASSDSGDDEIFSVQSYISSSVKGAIKNRGLKEDVKDWRIIVSIRLLKCINIFQLSFTYS
nr:MAG: rep 40 protein helicase [Chemarfal virus 36]